MYILVNWAGVILQSQDYKLEFFLERVFIFGVAWNLRMASHLGYQC